LRTHLEVVHALSDLLRRLRLRPPSQIRFRTIANTPTTVKFSRHELLNALYALEYEGVIALHNDHSFSVLKPSSAI
jgi:DNA-binding GntR family transcriptional regulator